MFVPSMIVLTGIELSFDWFALVSHDLVSDFLFRVSLTKLRLLARVWVCLECLFVLDPVGHPVWY